MSFNQFSPELLMKVFSYLLDVDDKIRLERVNRRFRDCIRNVESWKYNTTLNMNLFESDPIEKLHSFLKHAHVITTLEISLVQWELAAKYFGTLFMFSDKLKVTSFSYHVSYHPKTACHEFGQVVACCLGKFSSTLEKADITCCGRAEEMNACPNLLTLATMLPSCHKLREVILADIDEGANQLVLNSLTNMSLNKICLCTFYSPINGEHLAAVCNSAKNNCLSTIEIRCYSGGAWPMRFELAEFCESLEPAAAQAITTLRLRAIDCGWVELLPTFPAVFPNLTNIKIVHCPKDDATADDAVMMAQALGGFLLAGAQHGKPVTLFLKIKLVPMMAAEDELSAFGRWLWNSIDLIELRRSGTKRTADTEHWKRTLTHGIVTVSIEVEIGF